MLIAVVLAAAAMQAPLWGWEVDGAALDFGFARHLALGDGIVAQAGRERVEGFSNPTWISLLAVLQKNPATKLIVFYERDQVHQLDKLRARFALFEALAYPIEEGRLVAALLRARGASA